MNIQRNIFAGLLIFIVFLTIPIYLDFIGLNQKNSQAIIKETQNEEMSVKPTATVNINEIKPSVLNNAMGQIVVNTDYYRMVLSKSGGGSVSLYELTEKINGLSYKYLGSYDSNHIYNDSVNVALVNNLSLPSSCSPCLSFNEYSLLWDYVGVEDSIYVPPGQTHELTFVWDNVASGSAWKKIVINGDGYSFNSIYKYDFRERGDVEIVWDTGILPTEMGDADVFESHARAYIYQNGSLESITQSDGETIGETVFNEKSDWVGIRNKYFGVIIIPEEKLDYATLSSEPALRSQYDGYNLFEGRDITPVYTFALGNKNQSSGELSFNTYLGPLDVDHLSLLNKNVESIMNFGWAIIKPFSRFVLWFIKSLHSFLGINYGFILILVALIMRFVMGPLTRKGAESSAKMQLVAPLQKKLQEKYKDNPQQLQQEMGKLWKEHGVNPLSGCLPLLVQWPVLMAFFIVFRSTIEFRGHPFVFWIKDLSQPDYVFGLPFSIPFYGDAVAVLPIIMGISMFLTMGVTMPDNSQKTMMYFMNAFFILIFNSFPSGLTLYYTIFNLLSYQQQLSIKKNK